MNVLHTDHLSKSYGARRAIDDLSLELEEGTVCGFLGPNGVGKSTALRILMGLLRPSSGRASLFGLDCWRDGLRIRADVGYLPGDLRLYPWLTARLAFRLVGRIRRRALVAPGLALAERFDLEPDVTVRTMSRGMRQKLGLILALAGKPRLLLLDEPTSGLDPIIQDRLLTYLRELKEAAHTIFFSSHTLSEVERLCERVVILKAGRAVADTSLESLRSRAQRDVVLRWEDSAAPEGASLPEFLELREQTPTEWRCTLCGSAATLTRWLAEQRLADFSVGPPDLERLFRSFYGGSQ